MHYSGTDQKAIKHSFSRANQSLETVAILRITVLGPTYYESGLRQANCTARCELKVVVAQFRLMNRVLTQCGVIYAPGKNHCQQSQDLFIFVANGISLEQFQSADC